VKEDDRRAEGGTSGSDDDDGLRIIRSARSERRVIINGLVRARPAQVTPQPGRSNGRATVRVRPKMVNVTSVGRRHPRESGVQSLPGLNRGQPLKLEPWIPLSRNDEQETDISRFILVSAK